MTAGWQNPPDADVILRAPGGEELHAHKCFLSYASPVFRDMFSIPQPPAGSPQTPIIDVDDPPEALEIFLHIIYPTHNPLINDAKTLASVLRIADKYGSKGVLDIYKYYLAPTWSNFPPIEMYAILCVYGSEKEVGAVARRVSFTSLRTLNSNLLLQFITSTQYQRLVSFLLARDEKMREIASWHHDEIANDGPGSCIDDLHSSYSSTIVATLQAAFGADPCVQVSEALRIVLRDPCTPPQCKGRCRYGPAGLQEYAEGLLKELVEMGQNLSWENPHEG
jgi:hypothetical protein